MQMRQLESYSHAAYLLAPTFNQSIDQTISKEGEEDLGTGHKGRRVRILLDLLLTLCHCRATYQYYFLPFANSLYPQCGRHLWVTLNR